MALFTDKSVPYSVVSGCRLPWWERYPSGVQKAKRLETPVHYHLRNNDIMAATAELRRGADPLLLDEGGRSSLDLAVQMTCETLHSAICTSFPVDCLGTQSLYGATAAAAAGVNFGRSATHAGGPLFSPSVPYDTAFSNLYAQPQRLRYSNFQPSPASDGSQNLTTRQCPPFRRRPHLPPSSLNRSMHDDLLRRMQKATEGVTGADMLEERPKTTFPTPQFYDINDPEELERLDFQMSDLIVITETVLAEPIPPKTRARTNGILRRLKALLFFIDAVSESFAGPVLLSEARRSCSESLNRITFPFLYCAVMHALFRLYPKSPQGKFWDPESPADSRRLVNILLSRGFRGCELLQFIGALLKYLLRLFKIFGRSSWRINGEIAQFFLHMSFTLDSPALFEVAVHQPKLFSAGDLFKWDDLLYALMTNRQQFPRFFGALLHVRLKTRVQKRFSAGGEPQEEEQAEGREDPIRFPCEERYLTKDVLRDYAGTFGAKEVGELENLLREWNYGAVRDEESARPARRSRHRLVAQR